MSELVILFNVSPTDPAHAEVGTSFGPISILAEDSLGNPVSGYQIQIQGPPNGQGTPTCIPSSLTGTTGGGGIFTFYPQANDVQGGYSLQVYGFVAPYSGCSVGLINDPPTGVSRPASIVVTAGSGQTIEPGAVLPINPSATVYDQYGAPFAGGATITFNAPGSGASGTFAATGTRTQSGTTNSSGQFTTSAFTSNGVTGSFNISVSVSGLSGSQVVTVVVKAAAEVCTPSSRFNSGTNTKAETWTNPDLWVTGGSTPGALSVNPSTTSNNEMVSLDFDPSQLALMSNAALITSITFTDSISYGRSSANGPTSCRTYLKLASRGVISSTYTHSKGSTGDNVYVTETRTWNTFTNTGNVDPTKLFAGQLKNGEFQVAASYGAGEFDVYGSINRRNLSVVVCYVNPDGGTGSVPLHYCEV